MIKKGSVAARATCMLQVGLIWVLCTAQVSSAQDAGAGHSVEIVITRENLHSFSSGSDCKSVPYTGLVDGRAFIVAEAFVRMELWTEEGLEIPVQRRERLIDSRLYFYQGNAYADWYPDNDPEGGVCPELEASLESFPKELEGMLGLVKGSTAPLDPPCEPTLALTVNGNRVVQSYEMLSDCGLR